MIRLRLLGPLALLREDGTLARDVLAQPKRFALLAYLATAGPSSFRRRDTCLALFWPELDEGHGRKALRQALYGLRQALGPGVLTGKGRESVGVDAVRLECDAASFSSAVAAGREEEALGLYGGPFLEGFHLSGSPEFERWMEGERRRLELDALGAAWRLAERAAAGSDRLASRRWAERALELAPYDEESLRRYLELMAAQGQPAAAIRAFERFAERLSGDLDLEPSLETVALFERIRDGGGVSSVTPAPAPVSRPSDTGHRDAAGSALEAEAALPAAGVRTTRHAEAGVRGRMIGLAWVAGVAALGFMAFSLGFGIAPGGGGEPIRSVAVLPFHSGSGDPGQDYLADGLTEGLIGRLAEIGELRVPPATAVMRYRASPEGLPAIAEALGVGAVVEGSFSREGNRVRVSARLVGTPEDEVLWSGSYERAFEDFVALQGQMAQEIARGLELELSPEERERMADVPAVDPEAYSFYLQGLHYLGRDTPRDRATAEPMFERAVALDPGFTRAWERLVYTRGILLISNYDTARLAQAKEDLNRLRELGLDLTETRAAEGWYALWGELDFERALEEFRIVHERRPGDAEILWALGTVYWHTTRYDEAVSTLRRLLELDPGRAEAAGTLAEALQPLGRFEEAERAIDRAIALAPDNHWYYVQKWQLLVMGLGDTARARQVFEEAESHVRAEERAWQRALVAEFGRDFPAAIEGFGSWPTISRIKYGLVAVFADRLGDTAVARAHADSLGAIASARLENGIRRGNVGQIAVSRYELGIVHAVHGRWEEAIREAEEGLRLAPFTAHRSAARLARDLVWVYMRAGRYDDAVELLRRITAFPGGETYHGLRLNPRYDGLRGHAGFQAILREARVRWESRSAEGY